MQKKTLLKKTAGIVLAAALTCGALTACGGGKNDGDTTMLDLGSLMPTSNTTATVENPEVIQASKYIMEEYEKLTGVKTEFATSYGRSISATIEQTSEWYQHQIEKGNCPIIGYTSLNYFQDRDYYVALDEYLELPNPYVEEGQPGSEHWKDMFYDYVWEDGTIRNVMDEVVAIPILLSAGAQTGLYYNKEIFAEAEVQPPANWAEYMSVIKKIDSEGYKTLQPNSSETAAKLYTWTLTFSLTPAVLEWMGKTDGQFNIDYDKDGTVTNLEVLRGVLEGKFDPRTEGPAREVYLEAFDYYSDILPVGWQGNDSKTEWDSGKLAMVENGTWNIPMENSNTVRKFDYGLFPMPVAGADTFPDYAQALEYYDTFEEVKSPVSVALNIMKPAVSDSNGEIIQEKLDLAVDILMWLTAVENCSAMAEEKGGTLGAVQGSGYNLLIDDETIGWKNQKFPKLSYSASWPTGYTSAQSSIINKSFEQWVDGTIGDTTFFNTLYDAQKTGAEAYVKAFGIDTSGWEL